MNNLILITSVINTPNLPLSYTNTRSVFSRQERFKQTQKTIQSIKEKLPNDKIFIVECSDLTSEEQTFLNKNCDYILNLWEKIELHNFIFGISKSLGEGILTIQALKYIKNIEYGYLYKISGRYWLNEHFKLDKIDHNVYKKINDNENNLFTALYKIDKKTVEPLLFFLTNNIETMQKCIGYEMLMAKFVKTIDKEFVNNMGLSGFISVCGSELHY